VTTPTTGAALSEYPTAVEDYVKAIYGHTEWQPEPISSSALAQRLGLVPSSVTEMVKKLSSMGLVDHKAYAPVTLTVEGEALAKRMVRRHRLIETWLVQQFDYGWDEVHDEAEILEHALSDRMLGAIDAMLGHPTRDPHGDPIPAEDGTVTMPSAVTLSDATAPATGIVVRISDRDAALLRRLEAAGLVVDATVTVSEGHVLVGDTQLDLDEAALSSIWITA